MFYKVALGLAVCFGAMSLESNSADAGDCYYGRGYGGYGVGVPYRANYGYGVPSSAFRPGYGYGYGAYRSSITRVPSSYYRPGLPMGASYIGPRVGVGPGYGYGYGYGAYRRSGISIGIGF